MTRRRCGVLAFPMFENFKKWKHYSFTTFLAVDTQWMVHDGFSHSKAPGQEGRRIEV